MVIYNGIFLQTRDILNLIASLEDLIILGIECTIHRSVVRNITYCACMHVLDSDKTY